MRHALLLITSLLAGPALADRPAGVDGWIDAQSQSPLQWDHVGSVDIAPGGVIVVDPLTYGAGLDWPFIPTPSGRAAFMVARDAEYGRVSKAVLLFADGVVVCGHDEATVGVDTGLAAFLDAPRAAALVTDGEAFGANANMYDDWFADLIDDRPVVADLVPLPSGTAIPMMSSGWGDGGYPVASLRDKDGAMIALYVDFMGRDDEGNWLLPPECDGLPVTFQDSAPVSSSNL